VSAGFNLPGGGDWPDAGQGACCMGAAVNGPNACTCWVPVFELEQDPPRVALPPAGVRPGGMCGDCAYRPNSPERQGDPDHLADADELDRIVWQGQRFFCHDGMNRPTHYVHEPTGITHAGHPANYCPPIVDGQPYRADGQPGFTCAGWDARYRALHNTLDKIDKREDGQTS
jgi:hypothetical protein